MLLISARRLVMLYVCAKFHEIILKGIKVIVGWLVVLGLTAL